MSRAPRRHDCTDRLARRLHLVVRHHRWMTSVDGFSRFSFAHTSPSVLPKLSRERRKRLEVRRQIPQIVWAATRPTPRVSKVEADLNAKLLGQGNRAPELVVSVVPAKHDVLPDHANSGSHGFAMETNEISERHLETSANPVSAVTICVAAINGKDHPI